MPQPARKVGIRELKAQLSRVVHEAAAGQRFAVTEHGHVVAELGPVSAAGPQASGVAARVVALGGTAAVRGFDLRTPPRTADWQAVDVRAVLDELRGER